MIDLRNTCVLVRTKEENEMILKEAEKQGFHWYWKNDCKSFPEQHFPDILKFYYNKDVTCNSHIDKEVYTCYEASELLGTKEMTAREFAEWVADAIAPSKCNKRECLKCVFSRKNTKCNRSLRITNNWKDNIDELFEIVKSGEVITLTPEEKAIKNIEKLIKIPDHEITDEIKESLKLAVEKLKDEM